MADTAAALLDELMGKNRNVLPNEKFQAKGWEEPDVRHFKKKITYPCLIYVDIGLSFMKISHD